MRAYHFVARRTQIVRAVIAAKRIASHSIDECRSMLRFLSARITGFKEWALLARQVKQPPQGSSLAA
jgi:hypothetical protein